MKLDLSNFMFMTNNDYRVLMGIEMGMRNHEYVPTVLISSLSNLRREGINRVLRTLLQNKLIVHRNVKYDGYKLTYLGYDYLALKAFSKRGTVKSVGMQIGVGKESDIFICKDNNGELKCLKVHRLGRVSFRTIKNKRDYYGKKTFRNWLYLSKIAATKEYAYLKALYENNLPVPAPFDLNRHMIVMSYINGFPLAVVKLKRPAKIIDYLINILLRFAKADIIHGDFNEFNILIDDNERVTIIDFPQIISLQHENAAMYFDRDMNCIVEHFYKKYRIDIVDYPTYEDIVTMHSRKLISCDEYITKNEDSLLLSVLQKDYSGDEIDEENEEETEKEKDEDKNQNEEKEKEKEKEKNNIKHNIAHTEEERFDSCNESAVDDSEEMELLEREKTHFKKNIDGKKEKGQKKDEETEKVNFISNSVEDETVEEEEKEEEEEEEAEEEEVEEEEEENEHKESSYLKKTSGTNTEEVTQVRPLKEKYIKESMKREDTKEELKKEEEHENTHFKNDYDIALEDGINEAPEEYPNEVKLSNQENTSIREHNKTGEVLKRYAPNDEFLDYGEESEGKYKGGESSDVENISGCNEYENSEHSRYEEEEEIRTKELLSNEIIQFKKSNIYDSIIDDDHMGICYDNIADNISNCSMELDMSGAEGGGERYDEQEEDDEERQMEMRQRKEKGVEVEEEEIEEEEEEEEEKEENKNKNKQTKYDDSDSASDASHYSSCYSSVSMDKEEPQKLSGTWTPHIKKFTKEYVHNKIKYMNKKKSCKEKYKNSFKTKTKNAAMEKIKSYL